MKLNLNCKCGNKYSVEVTGEAFVSCPKCGIQAKPATISALIAMVQQSENNYQDALNPVSDDSTREL